MKTTIELPSDVIHRAQAVAARRRMTLKELVLRGIEHEISIESAEVATPDALIAALSVGRNKHPIGRLNRDGLHDRPILR